MQKIVLLFFMFFVSLQYGQYTVSGRITGKDNIPLGGSHIHIGNLAVNSNEEGTFSLSSIPFGKAKIYITHIGYSTVDTLIMINKDLNLIFNLKASKTDLEEVVVKHKNNAYNVAVQEQKIKLSTLEQYSNQSLGNVLREVSGVSVLKTGSTIVKPVINGLHSSRIPIFNNNIRLEDQQWGMEHAPNFDVNSAGKITVIKGASGLQYSGEAIGGLVLIEPMVVKQDTLFGKTISTIESNGRGATISTSLHRGNFCDWSWNAQSSFKYLGDRVAPDYNLSNTGNRETNFSGDVAYLGKKYDLSFFYSYYHATIGILSASHIGNVNDLYQSINNNEPYVKDDFSYDINNPRQKVQHHLAKINFNYRFKEGETISIQYAFQFNNRKEFDLRTGVPSTRPALDLDLMTHSLLTDYRMEYFNWDFKSGVSFSFQNNAASPDTGVRPLIPSYNKVDAAWYGIADYHFSEHFTVEGGIRYDFSMIEATKYYLKSRWSERDYSPEFNSFIVGDFGNQWLTKPEFTFHNFSASLGFQYEINPNTHWFFNVSRAVRNPNPSEFFSDGLHHSTGMIELGDLRLRSEKANKISTSFQKQFSSLRFMIAPFLNYIQDFMYLRPVSFETTIRGAFPVWEYQQTTALLSGIDIDFNWKIADNVQFSSLWSYVHGRDEKRTDFLIDMPPLNGNSRIRFTKKEWNELNLELRNEIVFTQKNFPNYNFTTNIVENGDLVPVEVDISKPPSGYQLLHFYGDFKFNLLPKVRTTLAFSVYNIFNTTYRDYLNRQRFYVDELGRNFNIQLLINY